jgi:hypothetical protein
MLFFSIFHSETTNEAILALFFYRFSRILAFLTTHRAFLNLSLFNIYIFDVKIAENQKKSNPITDFFNSNSQICEAFSDFF